MAVLLHLARSCVPKSVPVLINAAVAAIDPDYRIFSVVALSFMTMKLDAYLFEVRQWQAQDRYACPGMRRLMILRMLRIQTTGTR